MKKGLVTDPSLTYRKALYEVKASDQQFGL